MFYHASIIMYNRLLFSCAVRFGSEGLWQTSWDCHCQGRGGETVMESKSGTRTPKPHQPNYVGVLCRLYFNAYGCHETASLWSRWCGTFKYFTDCAHLVFINTYISWGKTFANFLHLCSASLNQLEDYPHEHEERYSGGGNMWLKS